MRTQSLPEPETRPTLSVVETAELLGTGHHAVREGIRRGDIPSIRVGHKIRIPTAAILRMLQLTDDPTTRTAEVSTS